MRTADIPAVIRIGCSAFSQGIPYSRRMWTEKEVLASISQNPDLCIVGTSNSRLVGFVLAEVVKREGGRLYCYLKWIAVSKRYRAKRLGGRLLRALQSRAKKKNCIGIFCDVEEDNTLAMSFFKSKGFHEEQRVVLLWKGFKTCH